MALNIKNAETDHLVHELAGVTGESLTTAVTVAVRERLDRLQRLRKGTLSDRLLKIGKDCAAHLKEPFHSVDHGDLLYNENGLARFSHTLFGASQVLRKWAEGCRSWPLRYGFSPPKERTSAAKRGASHAMSTARLNPCPSCRVFSHLVQRRIANSPREALLKAWF